MAIWYPSSYLQRLEKKCWLFNDEKHTHGFEKCIWPGSINESINPGPWRIVFKASEFQYVLLRNIKRYTNLKTWVLITASIVNVIWDIEESGWLVALGVVLRFQVRVFPTGAKLSRVRDIRDTANHLRPKVGGLVRKHNSETKSTKKHAADEDE